MQTFCATQLHCACKACEQRLQYASGVTLSLSGMWLWPCTQVKADEAEAAAAAAAAAEAAAAEAAEAEEGGE
jgi:hypothetical protein